MPGDYWGDLYETEINYMEKELKSIRKKIQMTHIA